MIFWSVPQKQLKLYLQMLIEHVCQTNLIQVLPFFNPRFLHKSTGYHAVAAQSLLMTSVGQSEGLLIPRSSVRFRLKSENSNSHGFELHRPSIKGAKLLLKVIKAVIIISQQQIERKYPF